MRKMTYTQAATCGENLKVRVTPEQSEKMQKAWFAAGKTWDGQAAAEIYKTTNSHFIYLCSDEKMSVGSYNSDFEKNDNIEIELIDDLTQHDFASQQDAWIWVSQGNKAKYIDGTIAGFKDGCLWDFSKNAATDDYCFEIFENWQKYTPPRLIRVNGVEVPAPLESLDGLSFVWVVKLGCGNDNVESHRASSDFARKMLSLELCYATKEDAIKRAESMVKYDVVE